MSYEPLAVTAQRRMETPVHNSAVLPGLMILMQPRDWSIDMNKKERRLALGTALQSASSDMVVVDDFSAFQEIKTKSLLQKLENVGVGQVWGMSTRRMGSARLWKREAGRRHLWVIHGRLLRVLKGQEVRRKRWHYCMGACMYGDSVFMVVGQQ